MNDPFVGRWKLNPQRSTFDANHRPTGATMEWVRHEEGGYLMTAVGTKANGESVTERPQRFIPDGEPRPVPDFPGLSAVTTQPNPHTIQAEARREDGSLAGAGNYVVSTDARSLTATTTGFDSQLRRFESRTVWDRV